MTDPTNPPSFPMAPPNPPSKTRTTRSRLGMVMVGLLVAVTLAFVAIALVQRSSISSEQSKNERLNSQVEGFSEEADELRASIAASEVELAKASEDLANVTEDLAQTELERDEAAETAESIDLATIEDLRAYYDSIDEIWGKILDADIPGQVQAAVLSASSEWRDLLALNVLPADSDCKVTIADNGYAGMFLFASGYIGLLDFGDPQDIAAIREEALPTQLILRTIVDDACDWPNAN